MESALQELIIQTTDPSTVQQASEKLKEMLQDPSIIPVLINLFSQTDKKVVRTACLVYLHKIIEANWASFPEEAKSELKELVLSLFSKKLEPESITKICSMAGTIYSKESEQWDQLISVILDSWSSQPFIASQLLVSIIDDFSWESNENSEDFAQRFLAMDNSFITSSNTQIQIAGLRILSSIIGSIADYDELPNFILIANKIASESPNSKYNGDDFTSIWNSISAIITTLESTENEEGPELVNQLIQTAVQVASSKELESTRRILPITSIVNEISSNKKDVDSNLFETTLNLVISVISQSIEENGTLPFDLLDLVSSFFNAQPPGGEIYSFISSKIFEALESENTSTQASGLLILRNLLVDAPENSHNDATKIASIINEAIASGDPLLVQASASVVEVFDETFKSMNIFSVEFLNAIIPYTVHPQAEVRHHCLRASLIIVETLDTDIPNFFKKIWELYENSSPNDYTSFFILIANSIKHTPEFDDDDVSTVMKLLQKVFQEKEDENLPIFASSLCIVYELISFDSQLSEDLLPEVLSRLNSCLEYPNTQVLLTSVTFLDDCITFFKDSGIDIVSPFAPRLLVIISSSSSSEEEGIVTESVKVESLLTLCRLVKHCYVSKNNEFDYVTLKTDLIKTINSFLDSDSIELQTGASSSICALAPAIEEDEICFSFLDKLISQIESHVKIEVIKDAIRAIARLLKCSQERESNSKMIEQCVSILTKIIEGHVAFLNETPLIEVDNVAFLFRNVCKLITALIAVKCQITDEICKFLLQFIQRESELDKSVAIGALSDAILYDAASPSICQSIVESVVDVMQSATDPGLQENVILLFNVCVIKQPQLVQPIMEILDKFVNWWTNALEMQSGFSDVIDNLTSLFIGLAISREDFPNKILIQVFQKFPRVDNDSPTTANMCRNIISFVETRKDSLDSDIIREIALSIARIFMLDKLRLNEMQIDSELQSQLQEILVSILKGMPNVLNEIKQICKKSKAKARRLQSIISSV